MRFIAWVIARPTFDPIKSIDERILIEIDFTLTITIKKISNPVQSARNWILHMSPENNQSEDTVSIIFMLFNNQFI